MEGEISQYNIIQICMYFFYKKDFFTHDIYIKGTEITLLYRKKIGNHNEYIIKIIITKQNNDYYLSVLRSSGFVGDNKSDEDIRIKVNIKTIFQHLENIYENFKTTMIPKNTIFYTKCDYSI